MANNPNRNQHGAKNSRIETPSILVPNTLMVFNNNIHISRNMPLFFAHPNNNNRIDRQMLTVPMPRKHIANFWENPQIFNIPQTYYHPEYYNGTANMTPFNETRKFHPTADEEEDKDDVVFVASYTRTGRMVNEPILRRNPTRKARENNKYLKKEHILEADFGILDENDEANLVTWKSRPSLSTSVSAASSLEENFAAPKEDTFKEWPINSFERPEYNPKTEKVEPFDYTIRNIQNQQLQPEEEPEFKTPKLEIVKPIIVKPKATRIKKCPKTQINNNLRRSKRGEAKKIFSSELSEVIEKTDCLLSNIETVSLPFRDNLNNIRFNQSVLKIIILSGANNNYENSMQNKL